MEFIREDCIYARQSVDRKDSISIESQIDFCKYELKGGNCRVFKDKGYSGKNTDRPEFQKLLGEIRKGKVRRVIVYKLDRISRSILDFANMMELFQEYDVEFVSSTEKFDTSTPMGRAMLNICIVFAQLERETIQKRVTDAYYSRCLKGFHMSGQAPYGYQLEPTVVEGIRTKKMVADPVAADHVRLMFEMYAEPETSFGDISYVNWRGRFKQLGQWFDKEAAVEKWLADYDAKAAELAARIRDMIGDETFAVLEANSVHFGSYYIYRSGGPGALVYDELKLTPSAGVPEKVWGEVVDAEYFSLIDADHIFFFSDDGRAGDTGNLAVWKNMKAVKAGNVYFGINEDQYNMAFTAMGKELYLEKLANAILNHGDVE